MFQSSIITNKADNFEFYSCPQGREILNSRNFTPDINNFLCDEHAIVQRILINHKNDYDALLEVGCGYTRNAELATFLGLIYFGIDFIENVVNVARSQLKEKNVKAQVDCLSVLDLTPITTPIPKAMRTVCLFPFNVFGNIFEPTRILQIMHTLNYAMLISTYRNDVNMSAILKYYQACGLNHIKTIKLDIGTIFISKEGFKSVIYNSEYIYHIAHELGLTIESFEFSKLGKLYYIR